MQLRFFPTHAWPGPCQSREKAFVLSRWLPWSMFLVWPLSRSYIYLMCMYIDTPARWSCSEPSMSYTPSPPSTIITPDNHGGLITITAAVGMTFALCSMGIRIYARTQINGPWGHDDSALLASAVRVWPFKFQTLQNALRLLMNFQVFCIFQSIAKMISVANGLGKTIEMIDPVKLLAVQKVANLSTQTGLTMPKTSTKVLECRAIMPPISYTSSPFIYLKPLRYSYSYD